MRFRDVVNKLIDHKADGLNVRAAVQTVVAANVNEQGTTTVAAHQRSDTRAPAQEGDADVREER